MLCSVDVCFVYRRLAALLETVNYNLEVACFDVQI